jgi:hypothetical protein
VTAAGPAAVDGEARGVGQWRRFIRRHKWPVFSVGQAKLLHLLSGGRTAGVAIISIFASKAIELPGCRELSHGPTSGSYSTIFQYESLRITLPLRNV